MKNSHANDLTTLRTIADACAFPERLLHRDGFWHLSVDGPDDTASISICPVKGPILYRDGHPPEILAVPLPRGSKQRLRACFGLPS